MDIARLTGAQVRVQRGRSMEDVADPPVFGRLHYVHCQAAHQRHGRRLLPSVAAAASDSTGQSHRVCLRCPDAVRRAQRCAGIPQSDDSFWTGVRSVCANA